MMETTKLIPLGGYSNNLKEKAKVLLAKHNSKVKIAEILGVSRTTVRRWLKGGEHTYYKPHSSELRQKARVLLDEGNSRMQIANKLNLSYFTVTFWLRGIGTKQKKVYPDSLKRKVRRFARKGLLKIEIARILDVSYEKVIVWTSDIKNGKSKLSGRATQILSQIINDGYFVPGQSDLSICRELSQLVPIKTTIIRGLRIYYLKESAAKAMQHLLEKKNISYMSATKLRRIQNTLYARN
jgi:hypothetical protein